ncbi:hypothetical protein PaG_05978 [Moesziomyces aphidis]|uniref:Uncharacterized protein n=1 Tax=Moesziomyces aphidis TaxID=84754 RepID=W3VEC1_MOEAP|nr:hypothetical protein PaG_05978 [Moesziomyces aphidis]
MARPSTFFSPIVLVALLLLGTVRAQFFQQFFGGNAGGSMFGQREQEPPPIRCPYKDTNSMAKDQAKRAGGSFDGVNAELDLGGGVCISADSCEEANRFLQGKA